MVDSETISWSPCKKFTLLSIWSKIDWFEAVDLKMLHNLSFKVILSFLCSRYVISGPCCPDCKARIAFQAFLIDCSLASPYNMSSLISSIQLSTNKRLFLFPKVTLDLNESSPNIFSIFEMFDCLSIDLSCKNKSYEFVCYE